jgi:hypothetical protein
MEDIENKFANINLNNCNLCKNNNLNYINSKFCKLCQTFLTKHFPNCDCIYCR